MAGLARKALAALAAMSMLGSPAVGNAGPDTQARVVSVIPEQAPVKAAPATPLAPRPARASTVGFMWAGWRPGRLLWDGKNRRPGERAHRRWRKRKAAGRA